MKRKPQSGTANKNAEGEWEFETETEVEKPIETKDTTVSPLLIASFIQLKKRKSFRDEIYWEQIQ